MEKMILDERTGWEYELIGEQYYLTGRVMKNGVLTPETIDHEPEEDEYIGVWGRRHLSFIREFKKALYLDLFLSGRLNAYLVDVDSQAEDLFLRTVKEMSAQEGVTEALKAEDQMAWVQRKNNICNRATEIVNQELVFI